MTIRNFPDHAANERTFLAWVRTALVVVALGFLVERFDLFLSYTAHAAPHAPPPHLGFGNLAGLTLIVLGIAMIAVAVLRFIRTRREIDAEGKRVTLSDRVDISLAALLILMSGGLLFYLVETLTQNA
jgi:putative membrane protein